MKIYYVKQGGKGIKIQKIMKGVEDMEKKANDQETEDDSFGEFTTSENPYTLTELTPNHTYSVNVRPAGDNNKWSDAAFFKTFFPAPAEFAANKITASSAEISWTVDAAATGLELQYIELPTPTDVEELSYDDGIVATNLGGSSSSAWTWGTMYPVSMLNGKKKKLIQLPSHLSI